VPSTGFVVRGPEHAEDTLVCTFASPCPGHHDKDALRWHSTAVLKRDTPGSRSSPVGTHVSGPADGREVCCGARSCSAPSWHLGRAHRRKGSEPPPGRPRTCRPSSGALLSPSRDWAHHLADVECLLAVKVATRIEKSCRDRKGFDGVPVNARLPIRCVGPVLSGDLACRRHRPGSN
jgi:hypothetical protein